jgi:hypothetical protein
MYLYFRIQTIPQNEEKKHYEDIAIVPTTIFVNKGGYYKYPWVFYKKM